VYARRQFCGNLEVYRPPKPLWNPRLREAATTLAASRTVRHTLEESGCGQFESEHEENRFDELDKKY